MQPISGHVFRVDRRRGPQWYAKYRLPDGRQMRLEDVTPQLLERWKTTIPGSNRKVQKRLVVLHGIFRRAMRVWGLPRNPVADVERPRVRVSTDVDAFSPEEVHALVRAAGFEQDGARRTAAAERAR